ncbi:hypothetical protein CU098_007982, partial [Rhizopus stolonifer]
MADYDNYEEYEDLDIDDFSNSELYESDIEIENDEDEQYIDINEKNTEIENDEDEQYIDIINKNIIMNSENIETTKYLTIYEKTVVIGQRATELLKDYKNNDFIPLIKITKNMINKF